MFEPASGREGSYGPAVDASEIHEWVRCVTASGFEGAVSRVGCAWKKYHVYVLNEIAEPEDRWIMATLGGGDDDSEPKIAFETKSRRWENVCEHFLAGVASGFERRRKGKRGRGYGALIDAILTVGNRLGPIEAGRHLYRCDACWPDKDWYID